MRYGQLTKAGSNLYDTDLAKRAEKIKLM